MDSCLGKTLPKLLKTAVWGGSEKLQFQGLAMQIWQAG